MLLDTVVLTIGPVVAKSLLFFWLNDTEILVDIYSDVVGAISLKIKGRIDQQRALRQFEAIGEKVAESLAPLFEAENSKLDDGTLAAIAHAVANTVQKAKITPKLLATNNLDPIELAQHILSFSKTETVGFSALEVDFFERVLKDLSQAIVEVASQLPKFTGQTFAEILQRESQLLDLTSKILEEIRFIRQQSLKDDGEESIARFETEYCLAVRRNLDRMELFGVDVSHRRYSLSVAYVTLSIKKETKNQVDEDEDEDRIILTANEILASHQRLLIKGIAGSGKTTLLRWIAVNAASKSFTAELAHWNNKIPFFIPLRSIGDKFPTPSEFPRFIVSSIADDAPSQWVQNQLKAGRAIVLIDGIDEISERFQMSEWLRDLVGTYPETIFIISSRPSAIDGTVILRDDFEDTELMPMSRADVFTFIDHWHQAISEVLPQNEKAELENLGQKLKTTIDENSAILNLATSPLLCAMLCALHRERFRQLPTDRIELYEACCAMLIDRRDKERDIKLKHYPELSYRQKCAILEDLAYHLIRNGWSEISLTQAVARISLKINTIEHLPNNVTGHEILKMLLERSGLIREPVNGFVDFAHRTFQEYMAAQEILDQGDIGVLLSNAHLDQWREVVILAAGRARKNERTHIIKGLLERGDQEKSFRHQLHLLAVACLETSTDVESDIKAEIQRVLGELVPPKNFTEAKALASARELVLQPLSKLHAYRLYAKYAAATIRTLSLIGGNSALSIIEHFKTDNRQTVVNELMRAWDYFDREEYGKRILSFVDIEYLSVNDLKGLKYIKSIKHLEISGLQNEADLLPLSNLDNISTLLIRDCYGISNLQPLATLSNLRLLQIIHSYKITDLSPVSNLVNLEGLRISYCPLISNYEAISNLRSLSYLHLTGISTINNIYFIEYINNLDSIFLGDLPNLVSIEPIYNLKNINSIRLYLLSVEIDACKLLEMSSIFIDIHECFNIKGEKACLEKLERRLNSGSKFIADL